MNNKTLVIIPSYNEQDNIATLVEKLISKQVDVLVVDDNSPDGTSAIVSRLVVQYPEHVHLITRMQGKSGRGSAVLAGFEWALAKGYELVVEMDADFSHDPEELPTLIQKIENADVVIGSRYLPQSRILNWPLRRRVFSWLANKLARFMLRIPLSDYTNGYRCYRRSAIEKLDVSRIPETGYIVLSYVAGQLWNAKCRFAEIPTVFVNRKRGASQVSKSEVFGALRGILRVRKYLS